MELPKTRVQVLDEAVGILFSANALGKGMNLFIFTQQWVDSKAN